ncbi:MAG: hypothetical protein KGJ55_02910 [Gammaproteobacteria bacterium]|nr:hypothetical protein [Gammaproteobacteria bacterium]
MKRLLAACALSALAIGTAHAVDRTPARTPPQQQQQQRMTDCNHKAKSDGLKGDARKAFMKKCLSKAGHAAAMGEGGRGDGSSH